MKLTKDTVRNKLVFLGTAGARYVSFGFLRQAGGIFLNFDGFNVHVDPGPGAFVHAHRKGIDPHWTEVVILSHRHLDHCADVNHIIEAMTLGGKKKKGTLFCPEDAISHDPVVLEYTRSNLRKVNVIKEGSEFGVTEYLSINFPVRHQHRVETYGVFFNWKRKIAYIADTRFFEGLIDAYKGVDLLILNVTMYKRRPIIDHLSSEEAAVLIKEINPKLAIMTHFGRTMLKAKPWIVAEDITSKTGVKTLAAYDNMIIDLESLQVVKQR